MKLTISSLTFVRYGSSALLPLGPVVPTGAVSSPHAPSIGLSGSTGASDSSAA